MNQKGVIGNFYACYGLCNGVVFYAANIQVCLLANLLFLAGVGQGNTRGSKQALNRIFASAYYLNDGMSCLYNRFDKV
jgi:hypothetical protein